MIRFRLIGLLFPSRTGAWVRHSAHLEAVDKLQRQVDDLAARVAQNDATLAEIQAQLQPAGRSRPKHRGSHRSGGQRGVYSVDANAPILAQLKR